MKQQMLVSWIYFQIKNQLSYGFLFLCKWYLYSTEAQEQVSANLANFAYDPLNFDYLKESKAVELFLQLLHSPNPNLKLHGIAGLCNICLGKFQLDHSRDMPMISN